MSGVVKERWNVDGLKEYYFECHDEEIAIAVDDPYTGIDITINGELQEIVDEPQ